MLGMIWIVGWITIGEKIESQLDGVAIFLNSLWKKV